MNCPKCQERLRKEVYRKRDYMVCFHCEGIWISGESLISEGLGDLGVVALAPTEYPCPACEMSMDETVVENIHLECCARCNGVFFDAGELERAFPGYMDTDIDGLKGDAMDLVGFLIGLSRFISAVRSAMSRLP